MPISIVGTFAVMYALGLLHQQHDAAGARRCRVGFVVDDAIVMLENIVRHIEGGMRPFEAALKGSREIGFTIISITLLADRGVHPGAADGRHRRPRVPRIRRHDLGRDRRFRLRLADADADAVRARAEGPRSARHERSRCSCCAGSRRCSTAGCAATNGRSTGSSSTSPLTLLVTLATLVGTIWLYIVVPKGFFPTRIPASSRASTEAATDTSFEAMSERQAKVAEIIRQDPAVDYVNSTVGSGGPNATANYGRHVHRR